MKVSLSKTKKNPTVKTEIPVAKTEKLSGITEEANVAMEKGTTAKVKKQLILVAEDNAVNMKVITRHLAKLGFESEVAYDGAEAVKLVKSNPTAYSLILMDLQMPIMDGFVATNLIREFERQHNFLPIPILALSANTSEGVQEQCKAVGMSGYISKPVQVSTLADALRKQTFL